MAGQTEKTITVSFNPADSDDQLSIMAVDHNGRPQLTKLEEAGEVIFDHLDDIAAIYMLINVDKRILEEHGIEPVDA